MTDTAVVSSSHPGANPYIIRGQRVLLQHLILHGHGSIDCVRSAVELPAGIDPTFWGSLPRGLVRAGIIIADGYTITTRPEAHGRPIKRWRLLDRAKAEQWLAAHVPRMPPARPGESLNLFPSEPTP